MEKLQFALIAFVPLLFSLSFHEAAHAWAANKLGDPTAKYAGRLTLNPLPHIDWIGTVILPFVFYMLGGAIFGWAKPVPVNERNLRHGHIGGLLVAAAGPVSNILLAVMFSFVMYGLSRSGNSETQAASMLGISFKEPLLLMVNAAIQLNVFLAVFNLLPLPPLDGSRVAVGFFPQIAPQMAQIERYGFLILVLLMYTNVLTYLVYLPANMFYHFLLTNVAGV